MSEFSWLLGLLALGVGLWAFGSAFKKAWLWKGEWIQHGGGAWLLHGPWGAFTWNELGGLHNTTLPSVLERIGYICAGGALMGFIEKLRPRLPGPNPVIAASHESLLLYMLHLNLVFGLLLTPGILALTGWDWGTQGWIGTLLITAGIIAVNLWAGLAWQKVRKAPERMRRLQRFALGALAVWFLAGGWWTFRFYLESPELAREPYPFLNAARQRKGLPATPDGLCREPEEYFREAVRRKLRISEEGRVKITEQLLRRAGQPS